MEWRCTVPPFESLSWYVGSRTWSAYITPALCLKVGRQAIGHDFFGLVILDVDPRSGAKAWIEAAGQDGFLTPEQGQRWAYDAAIAFLSKVLGALGAVSANTIEQPTSEDAP